MDLAFFTKINFNQKASIWIFQSILSIRWLKNSSTFSIHYLHESSMFNWHLTITFFQCRCTLFSEISWIYLVQHLVSSNLLLMAKPSNSFFGDCELSPFFRLSGPGKLKNIVTFHQKIFFKGSEWQNLVTSYFDCSYFTGRT